MLARVRRPTPPHTHFSETTMDAPRTAVASDVLAPRGSNKKHRLFRPATLFLLLTLFVGLASAFDAYLNLKYPVTVASEENPLARRILEVSGDNDFARARLLGLKFGGTLIALHVLWWLFSVRRTRPLAWAAVSVLVVFQGSLLFYMTDGFRVI